MRVFERTGIEHADFFLWSGGSSKFFLNAYFCTLFPRLRVKEPAKDKITPMIQLLSCEVQVSSAAASVALPQVVILEQPVKSLDLFELQFPPAGMDLQQYAVGADIEMDW